jgi:GNAT superfamily N-acetyltransferase
MKRLRSRIRAYSIASVSPSLLTAVEKLHTECFGQQDYYATVGKFKHELSLNILGRLFVAMYNGAVVGYLLVGVQPQFGQLRGERLGISRKWRRKGLGRALVMRALEYSHKEDMQYRTYVAIENTASVRLHLNCGLQITKSDKTFLYLQE